MQSPIYLAPPHAQYDAELFNDEMLFSNYLDPNRTFNGVLSNNGRSVMWRIDANSTADVRLLPRISGANLQAWFILDRILFHWGDSNIPGGRGSDHVVDDNFRTTPAEVQFLHYNFKYGSFEEAYNQPDGLAGVAFLLKPCDYPLHREADYSELTSNFYDVAHENTQIQTANIHIDRLLPFAAWEQINNDTFPIVDKNSTIIDDGNASIPTVSGYYRYHGSLTMPPCSESVLWTVYPDPVHIDPSEMNLILTSFYRNDLAQGVQPLIDTWRPIQNMNRRIVTTNSPRLAQWNSASQIAPPTKFHFIITGFFVVCLRSFINID